MTPDDFKAWQAAQGWSNQQAADWLGLTRDAVKKIRGGHTQRISGPVVRAIQLRQCLTGINALLDAFSTGSQSDIHAAWDALPAEFREQLK